MSIGKENINIFYGRAFNHILLIVSSSYLVCFFRNLMSSSVSCCFTQHIPILNHKCFSRTYKVLLDVQYTTIPQVLATLAAGCHWTLGDRGHNVPSVSWYWCRYGIIILHLLPKYKLSLKDSTLSISLYILCTCKYWESLNNSNILRPWHDWCYKFSHIFSTPCSSMSRNIYYSLTRQLKRRKATWQSCVCVNF